MRMNDGLLSTVKEIRGATAEFTRRRKVIKDVGEGTRRMRRMNGNG